MSDLPAVTAEERRVLRELAARVRAIADLPEMAVRRKRLCEHNALRGDRPIVLCFPEGSWGEMMAGVEFRCSHPWLREWEWQLRSRLVWWEQLRDDGAIDPVLDVGIRQHTSGFGVDIPTHQGADRGSYVWEAPLKNLDGDLARLSHRTVTVDHAATMDAMQLAGELVGDLLPPRLETFYFWSMGMTQEAIRLYGIQPFLTALADDPEGIHRLMAFLRDDFMGIIDQIEAQHGFALNNRCHYAGSGGFANSDELPGADFNGRVGARHRWGFAESQETVGVSPRMFARLIMPYQTPLLERFGLNCYGCCEPVHQRLDAILAGVPRLRRLSVSPWTDQEKTAERIGRSMIFSRKPNPALVCVGFAEEEIRRDLARTAALASRIHLEIVLKDTHTVQNQPWRLRRWIELAYQAIGVVPEPLQAVGQAA